MRASQPKLNEAKIAYRMKDELVKLQNILLNYLALNSELHFTDIGLCWGMINLKCVMCIHYVCGDLNNI